MRLLFKVCIAAMFLAGVCSCEKVTKININLSPAKISATAEGGVFTVNSSVEDFDLEGINIRNSDGEWVVADVKKNYEDARNPNDCTGLEYDWITVRKQINSSDNKCQLRIEISPNTTGTDRVCSVGVHAGDSGDGVLIEQTGN